ncbi:MAG: hypothetical protein WC329_05845 [Candidatus Omnitrophota bacterium]
MEKASVDLISSFNDGTSTFDWESASWTAAFLKRIFLNTCNSLGKVSISEQKYTL